MKRWCYSSSITFNGCRDFAGSLGDSRFFTKRRGCWIPNCHCVLEIKHNRDTIRQLFWEFCNRIMQVIAENRSSWFFVIFSLGGCGGVVEYSQYSAEVENTWKYCDPKGVSISWQTFKSHWIYLTAIFADCLSIIFNLTSFIVYFCLSTVAALIFNDCLLFLVLQVHPSSTSKAGSDLFSKIRDLGRLHRYTRESPWGQWKNQTQTM